MVRDPRTLVHVLKRRRPLLLCVRPLPLVDQCQRMDLFLEKVAV
jgi:hypothetical protein